MHFSLPNASKLLGIDTRIRYNFHDSPEERFVASLVLHRDQLNEISLAVSHLQQFAVADSFAFHC